MQRRAAAAYVALFLVVAAGSYALIATGQGPTVSVEEPDHEFRAGDTLTVDGREYTVRSVEVTESEGGGHGGGGGKSYAAELAWTNESARYTESYGRNATVANLSVTRTDGAVELAFPEPRRATFQARANVTGVDYAPNVTDEVVTTLADGSTQAFALPEAGSVADTAVDNATLNVTYFAGDVRTYGVQIPRVASGTPTEFTLRERVPAGTELVNRSGRLFVVLDGEGAREELVPIEEYAPLERHRVAGADEVTYRGNASTLTITNGSVEFAWTAPATRTVSLSQANNVTLNGQTYLAYFPDEETVQLTDDFAGYRQQVARADRYHERTNGLWGVTIASSLAAFLLLSVAFLPRRDT